ncbi:MAG: diacylglycerol kinase family protein [Holdemanella porci]
MHLYVCGGDGTLHEVINGCAEKENVTISVIPIGTGNDFVKYFEDLKKRRLFKSGKLYRSRIYGL